MTSSYSSTDEENPVIAGSSPSYSYSSSGDTPSEESTAGDDSSHQDHGDSSETSSSEEYFIDENSHHQNDSEVRFSVNAGRDVTPAKISRVIKANERRKDIGALYKLFNETLKDSWRDVSQRQDIFPLTDTKSMKMDTRSESSGVSLEGGYTQKDVNIYRYLSEDLTVFLYRVGMGGSGKDSSLKSGGTGVKYGVSTQDFIASKPEGDYTKMFLFGFPKDLKQKMKKEDITFVKFPITEPPFSYILQNKNTSLGDKIKDKIKIPDKKKVSKKKEKSEGPFLFFCSRTYKIPSTDKEERKFWAFCFNRSNLLYILDVSYGTIESLMNSPNTGPPPPSSPPPPLPKGVKTSKGENVTSSERFRHRRRDYESEESDDLMDISTKEISEFTNEDYQLMTQINESFSNNRLLYSESPKFREELKEIFSAIGKCCMSDGKFKIKRELFEFEKLLDVGAKTTAAASSASSSSSSSSDKPKEGNVLSETSLQTRKLYLIQEILESDIIQKILKTSSGQPGYFIGLSAYFIRNYSEGPNANFFALFKKPLRLRDRTDEEYLRFSLQNAMARKSVWASDKVNLNSTAMKHLHHLFQIFSTFSVLSTLTEMIHQMYLHSEKLKEHPIIPVIIPNYEIIPGVVGTKSRGDKPENWEYKFFDGDNKNESPPIQKLNYITEELNEYFKTDALLRDRIQREAQRSRFNLKSLEDMGVTPISMRDTFSYMSGASIFACKILSYIDLITYAHVNNLMLILGNNANSKKSYSNIVFFGFQTLHPLVKEIARNIILPYLIDIQREKKYSELNAWISFLRIVFSSSLKSCLRFYNKEEDKVNPGHSVLHTKVNDLINRICSEHMIRHTFMHDFNRRLASFVTYNFGIPNIDGNDLVVIS